MSTTNGNGELLWFAWNVERFVTYRNIHCEWKQNLAGHETKALLRFRVTTFNKWFCVSSAYLVSLAKVHLLDITFRYWQLVNNTDTTLNRIVLKWMSRKQAVKVWIGFIWLRIGTSVGLLWTRWWTFGFRKRQRTSWVAEGLSASEEGLCCMEWGERKSLKT
jgi:hypothetical protein